MYQAVLAQAEEEAALVQLPVVLVVSRKHKPLLACPGFEPEQTELPLVQIQAEETSPLARLAAGLVVSTKNK